MRAATAPRRRARRVALLLLGGAAAVAAGAALHARRPAAAPSTTFGGPTMGTRYVVTVGAALGPDATQAAKAVVERELAHVDALMSNWRPDSEIERFNRARTTAPAPVSQELAELVAVARRVADVSAGAFDITVAPVVRAWGFGPSPRLAAAPTEQELAAARAAADYRLLDVELEPATLTKRRPETACDLSGIAPGYAADRVAAALLALGHRDVLVDIGGEVKALGHRPGGGPWRVAVEAPPPRGDGRSAGDRRVAAAVGLSGLALATSGDYRDFVVDAGGQRRSHIVDPRTARPVEHALASASVVRASATEADALATALMVLGPDEGLALAEREHLAAYFVVRGADGSFETRQTRAFAALRAD